MDPTKPSRKSNILMNGESIVIGYQRAFQKVKGSLNTYVFDKTSSIGRGAFAQVYKAWSEKDPNMLFAIKEIIIPLNNDQKLANIRKLCEREIKHLGALKAKNSPNIVNFLEFMHFDKIIYIVMEYCEGGDLKTFLKDKFPLTTDEAIMLFNQLLNAFKFINEGDNKNRKVHRDIKPENILVKNGVLKISDFQFMTELEEAKTVYIGTLGYMAPEMMEALEGSQSKVDIFSLGVVLYWLLTGKTPWEIGINAKNLRLTHHTVLEEMKEQLTKGSKKILLPKEIMIDEELQNLISSILAYKTSDRIGWDDLFKHKRLKQEGKPLMIRNIFFMNTENKIHEPFLTFSLTRIIEIIYPEESEQERLIQIAEDIKKMEESMKIIENVLLEIEKEYLLYLFFYNTLTKLHSFKNYFDAQRDLYFKLIYFLSKLTFIYSRTVLGSLENNENVYEFDNPKEWETFVSYRGKSTKYEQLKKKVKLDHLQNTKNLKKIVESVRKFFETVYTVESKQFLEVVNDDYKFNVKMMYEYMSCLKKTIKFYEKELDVSDDSPGKFEKLIFIEDLFLLLTQKSSFEGIQNGNFNLFHFYEHRGNLRLTIHVLTERIRTHYNSLKARLLV